MLLCSLVAPALAYAGSSSLDCAATGIAPAMQAASGSLRVWMLPQPAPIPVGKFFRLEVLVCEQGVAPGQSAWAQGHPQLVQVQAEMPAHRHGMNYVPTWAALQPVPPSGQTKGPPVGQKAAQQVGEVPTVQPGLTTTVQGMMFHMPGMWRVTLDLHWPATPAGQPPQTVRISHDVLVR